MIVGVCMVRDEIDVLPYCIENMKKQGIDYVIAFDDASTDGTREYMFEEPFFDLVVSRKTQDRPYMQADIMTDLATTAFTRGAHWVVPFDADEFWFGTESRTVAEALTSQEWDSEVAVAPATLYDHIATGDLFDNPAIDFPWRQPYPAALVKIAARRRPADTIRIHQGNHNASFRWPHTNAMDLLEIRHFSHRSVAQFLRKVKAGSEAYKAAGDKLPPNMGLHWRQWGQILETMGEDATAAIFTTWFYRSRPWEDLTIDGQTLPALVFDPAPLR